MNTAGTENGALVYYFKPVDVGKKSPPGDDSWYHCERLDKVVHHNSWVCQKIDDINATYTVPEPRNPQAITKLALVSWYVPKVFHRAVIHRQLAETEVKII